MSRSAPDIIPIEAARTLDGLFRERVRRSPDAVAYRYFSRHQKRWADLTWMEMHGRVG
ncbi:MAG: long-chain fatty acid--CoA ligase, partial [Gammaproteobacteria bacterium]|nr:long-chain fatty acid--CoA ligase [Gammaproteobacteria bacterium]NIR85238.1 long-chain fatty acid--CoA ligase [Gammaproteobacteria bacterium]NIU06288.1 long-chain fatty acid--CoA ligase [Gammaproteobacteria bacterium]NIX87561.1 long-chain fatty acid--CoA ligase [Gammaproteobacteria bacterium]